MNPVDEYIATFPVEAQAILQQVRATIRLAVPDAVEKISWRMPAYQLHNRPLAYFAGFKNHVGLYPLPEGIEAFKDELAPYKQGKGSVQFPYSQPMPLELIARMVKARAQISES